MSKKSKWATKFQLQTSILMSMTKSLLLITTNWTKSLRKTETSKKRYTDATFVISKPHIHNMYTDMSEMYMRKEKTIIVQYVNIKLHRIPVWKSMSKICILERNSFHVTIAVWKQMTTKGLSSTFQLFTKELKTFHVPIAPSPLAMEEVFQDTSRLCMKTRIESNNFIVPNVTSTQTGSRVWIDMFIWNMVIWSKQCKLKVIC